MRVRVMNKSEWRRGVHKRPDTDMPKAVNDHMVRDFSRATMAYNLSKIDLEIHWFGEYGRNIPTMAWTAGEKVVLLMERRDVQANSPIYLSRDADRQFLVFLMFHELGHNYWAPESVIVAYTASKLYQHEGHDPEIQVGDVTSQLVDIVVNTHLMNFDGVRKYFPEYTGKSLVKSNFLWDYSHSPEGVWDVDDVNLVRQKWEGMNDFEKWLLYFYHNETLPCPNQRILEPLKRIIAKRANEPFWAWKDEFYPLWIGLVENYGRH